ncbi:MAG: spermidine/putrescine ABC transporter substrate-binding protein [Ilumatobacter fluminis]|uniref:polyamine ABC transporter substrate-binding protein n=1 Tax=Ilumatobacter fluminis TaxID=467091 RepID=UPI0032EC43C6
MITKRRTIAAAVVASLALAACGGDDDEPAADDTDDAADDSGDGDDADSGDDAAEPAGDGPDCAVDEVDGDLFLYNWAEYIDPELLTAFEEQYGVSVTQDTYDSNEAMQPIISAGNSGYDVIVPSDYMVSIMIANGDVMALNKAAIPNYSNLADDFESGLPYDPEGAYAAPYQWGTTGLGVDKAVTGEDFPRSWALVFDQATADEYGTAGSISLLNDPRETLGAALKYLGYSLNSTSEEELNEAKDLVANAPIQAFDSDGYDENLATGQTVLAHGYSGNFFVQFDEADDPEQYEYFVPDEGGTRWVDNMAVVHDAPHPCTAHTFINFILDAENGAALTNWNYYASPNEAAEASILPEILEDPAIYPDDLEKLEFISDTGDYEINFSDAFIEAKG